MEVVKAAVKSKARVINVSFIEGCSCVNCGVFVLDYKMLRVMKLK